MAERTFKILIADDEPDILEFITYNLVKENFEVITATDGVEAIKLAKVHHPDLVILDIMMPKLDGIAVCEHLREMPEFKNTLIIFLTALGDENSEIKGLNTGADDYIVKPIKPKLLVSRVNALLRRFTNQPEIKSNKLTAGGVTLDPEQFLVHYQSTIFSLPRKEFELLHLLISKPGKVFHREDILSQVWGTDVIVGDRTIDVHIRKLRQKLSEDLIVTIKGVGYKFDA